MKELICLKQGPGNPRVADGGQDIAAGFTTEDKRRLLIDVRSVY